MLSGSSGLLKKNFCDHGNMEIRLVKEMPEERGRERETKTGERDSVISYRNNIRKIGIGAYLEAVIQAYEKRK